MCCTLLHPVDLALDSSLDLIAKAVQVAVANVLPQCHLVSCAIDCSTKSRIREIPLSGKTAPRPLRTEARPRGLPGLQAPREHRIAQDNFCSDFVLAVQHVMQAHGRAAIRENPRNSLHWWDDVEQWLFSHGNWYDWSYDACCLFASRRKKQRIRHCIPHMRSLPDLMCAHLHDPEEWAPSYKLDGSQYFPSREEAEYKSHVATGQLIKVLQCCVSSACHPCNAQVTGDLCLSFRLAFCVLRPCQQLLRTLAWWLLMTLRAGCQCQMFGHQGSRSQITASILATATSATGSQPLTFSEGRDGTPQEVVLKYARWLPTSALAPFIHEFAGKQLLCDCGPNQFCHGDVLVGEFNQARASPVKLPRVRSRQGRILLGMIAGFRIPAAVAHQVTQAHVVTSVKNIMPGIDWTGCRWPLIENLVNHDSLLGFSTWMAHCFPDLDQEYGPLLLAHHGVLLQRAGAQAQPGGASMRASLAPLVSFRLDKDRHFSDAICSSVILGALWIGPDWWTMTCSMQPHMSVRVPKPLLKLDASVWVFSLRWSPG